MFPVFELFSAISVLYQHVKETLTEEDFWPLTKEHYDKLPPEDQAKEWFMINPSKLKKTTKQAPEIQIVSAEEKPRLLQAIRVIEKFTAELPADSSFLERLLYAKRIIPSSLF